MIGNSIFRKKTYLKMSALDKVRAGRRGNTSIELTDLFYAQPIKGKSRDVISFPFLLQDRAPSVLSGGYGQLYNELWSSSSLDAFSKVSRDWRIYAAAFYLWHHACQGYLRQADEYVRQQALAGLFGHVSPSAGRSWFIAENPPTSHPLIINKLAVDSFELIERGFCWLAEPAAMWAKFGSGVLLQPKRKISPFDDPRMLLDSALEDGRRVVRMLQGLNGMPELSDGLEAMQTMALGRALEWREELYACPRALEVLPPRMEEVIEQQAADEVGRMALAESFRRPLVLEKSAYVSSMEGIYGVAFDSLWYPGALPSEPETAARLLQSLWWPGYRPGAKIRLSYDLLQSERYVAEAKRFAELAAGRFQTVWGEDIEISIDLVVRN